MNKRTFSLPANKSRNFLNTVFVVCLVLNLFYNPPALADSSGDQLFFNPSTSQINIGSQIDVKVGSYAASASTGTVNGAITFPSNLLQIQKTVGGSYDSLTITPDQASGIISFNGKENHPSSGIGVIFTVTFTAINSGAATLAFSNNSTVNSNPAASKTGTYTINPSNTPSPPPPTIPKTKPSPITLAPTTVQPSNVTPSPQISTDPSGIVNTVVITPSYTTSTITWKVNTPNPSSTLAYGVSYSTLDKHGEVTNKPDGSFTSTITGLTPGITYYFSISGTGSGNNVGTYTQSFSAQGYPTTITITENKIAVKSATLQIGSQNYQVTNSKITVNLAAGNYSGTVTTDTATLPINLTVVKKAIPSDGSAPESQNFSFNLTSSALSGALGSGSSIFALIGVLIGGSAILIIAFLLYVNYRRHRFETADSYSNGSSSTVVINDGYNWKPDNIKSDSTGVNSNNKAIVSPMGPTLQVQQIQQPHHTNSVYISDEEPIDMFDRVPTELPKPSSENTSPAVVIPRNPNLPHSTMP